MKLIGLVCFALCVVLAFASNPVIEPRIVHGQKAAIGQFPYQASLRIVLTRRHFCGASIISSRFLLTAAHCQSGLSRVVFMIVAVVGAVDRHFDGVTYRIDKIMKHKEHNDYTHHNDISLLRTAKEIVFTANIQPIALPKQNDPGNTPVVVSGWGKTKVITKINDFKIIISLNCIFGTCFHFQASNIFLPYNLQYVNVRTLNYEECIKEFLPDSASTVVHPEYTVCAFAKGKAVGICIGDSGKLTATVVQMIKQNQSYCFYSNRWSFSRSTEKRNCGHSFMDSSVWIRFTGRIYSCLFIC